MDIDMLLLFWLDLNWLNLFMLWQLICAVVFVGFYFIFAMATDMCCYGRFYSPSFASTAFVLGWLQKQSTMGNEI